MHIAILFFACAWIANCIMQSANQWFTYPYIVNWTMYVQLDELV